MLRYLLILFILTGCTGKQHRKTERIQANAERLQIDSLYLVKNIPVVVIDSLQNDGWEGISAFSQKLLSVGFSQITKSDEQKLSREYMKSSKLFSTDPKDRQKVRDLMSQNPDYFINETKRARPFAQTIKVLPCYPSQPGCVQIKRNNHPYAIKTRKWVFNKKEDMTDESFVSHIISVIAPSVR